MAKKKTVRKKIGKRKTDKRKGTLRKEMNLGTALSLFIYLLIAASIYFQSKTAILGTYVGGFFFSAFGVMAYVLPPIVLLYFLAFFYNKFEGKPAKNLIYIGLIFFCVSLIIAIMDSPDGSFKTTMELASEHGRIHVGAGVFGAFFTFFLQELIGNIGIYIFTALTFLFFALNLFDIKLMQFLQMIGVWIKSLFTGISNGISSIGENREKRLREQRNRKKHSQGEGKPEPDYSDNEYILINDGSENNYDKSEENIVEEIFNDEPVINISNYTANETEQKVNDSAAESQKKLAEEFDKKNIQKEIEVPTGRVPLNSNIGGQVSIENMGFPIEKEEELYTAPPIELLRLPKKSKGIDEDSLKDSAGVIEKTLDSFGISARVVSIQRGPTVTQFELKPQAGIKVSKITSLSDDLALSLAASDIRIEAPIPGKPYVGIEVPNTSKDDVLFREILQTPEYKNENDSIPIALGQSIEGKPVIAKISKMPHLLIAGATGSGKSVCINTIIMSILYKYTPKEVSMILIDPKVVELSVYAGIPHLLIPVVTDPKKASKALWMAVQEMERRFKLFSKHSVRDIKGYREKMLIDDELENLPYIVVIIDELSDLMMVASKDVEAYITRLAQMARACGIHLIIATQRPSVDVITGTIKANIPSRISFQVSSSIDSRTILDMGGAEKLLGKGDMLYYPSDIPKPVRIQGAFISDKEVSNVTNYIRAKHDAKYDKDLMASIEKASVSSNSSGDDDNPKDTLMDEVLEFISHEETTSISGLQRRFRIGYARAGRIIDDLEAMGAVSPQDGAKPRDVLINESTLRGDGDNEFTE